MRENRIMSVMLKRDTSSATVSDMVALASMLESPMLTGNCRETERTGISREKQGLPEACGGAPRAPQASARVSRPQGGQRQAKHWAQEPLAPLRHSHSLGPKLK